MSDSTVVNFYEHARGKVQPTQRQYSEMIKQAATLKKKQLEFEKNKKKFDDLMHKKNVKGRELLDGVIKASSDKVLDTSRVVVIVEDPYDEGINVLCTGLKNDELVFLLEKSKYMLVNHSMYVDNILIEGEDDDASPYEETDDDLDPSA